MSIEQLSIGNELKDSFGATSKWINNGIQWLSDVEDFYRERAAIEKEYSSKLKDLCSRHFEKKAKVSAKVSVGDEPQITPGSLECASLVLWTEVLTQTEAIAEEKAKFSKDINTIIGDNLVTLQTRATRISKHIEEIDGYLVSEKERGEAEYKKAKKNYDSLCQSTENAREKAEKSSSEKYQKRLQDKEIDMNVGKNEYLISISIANRLKDKYYHQDVPELLDYFQELNENRITLLNKLLKNASIIERNSCDKVKEKLHLIDGVIDQNKPELDTLMFIKHNLKEWKEQEDFYFVPSDIWLDDETLVTKEPELTELKKKLNTSRDKYSKYEGLCLETKQKLEESTVERKNNQANLTLKFDSDLSNSLSLLNRFMKNDTERVRAEVEIELIQNFAGDKDLSYHEQAKQKKSLLGFMNRKKHTTPNANADASSDTQSIHTVKSNTSHTIGKTGIFSLRRSKTKSSVISGGEGITGRALYQYASTGEDEVSINEGDQFNVVEEDEGSGWTLISLPTGEEGLVPTSYIEIQRPVASSSKKVGPSVAPKRGARRVQYLEALYDYEADGDDELSISAGDKIILLQDDVDGSGWTEGELNGNKGMFPTSYVRKL